MPCLCAVDSKDKMKLTHPNEIVSITHESPCDLRVPYIARSRRRRAWRISGASPAAGKYRFEENSRHSVSEMCKCDHPFFLGPPLLSTIASVKEPPGEARIHGKSELDI